MTELEKRIRRWSGRLPRHLRHVVDIDVTDSPAQAARRRFVVSAVHLIGTALLGASLSTRPGSGRFYSLTFSTAATWVAGSLLSGPLHLGWIENRARQLNRPVAVPVATGVGAFCIFSLGALVVRRIPLLDRAVNGALVFAERGRGPWVLLTTCANGIGEEVFFRGAMYAALPGTHPVLSSTAVYTLTTTATRNPALILAAGVMGTLFGYQRRATHGLRAPAHPPNLVHTDGDPTATDLQAGRSTIQEGLVSTPPARCDPVHQWCRDTAAAHSVASTLNPAHPSHLRRLTTIRQQAPRGASRKANPRAVHRTRSAGLSAGCLGGKGSADLALSGVCRIAVVGLY